MSSNRSFVFALVAAASITVLIDKATPRVVGGGAGFAFAQDPSTPEELRRQRDDALAQLKAAQDRKNELATENEKLQAQLSTLHKENDELRSARAEWAEATYSLRAHHAAWRVFLAQYPALRSQWELFLASPPLYVENPLPQWSDVITHSRGAPAAGSTTSPESMPTSQPTAVKVSPLNEGGSGPSGAPGQPK